MPFTQYFTAAPKPLMAPTCPQKKMMILNIDHALEPQRLTNFFFLKSQVGNILGFQGIGSPNYLTLPLL